MNSESSRNEKELHVQYVCRPSGLITALVPEWCQPGTSTPPPPPLVSLFLLIISGSPFISCGARVLDFVMQQFDRRV